MQNPQDSVECTGGANTGECPDANTNADTAAYLGAKLARVTKLRVKIYFCFQRR